MQPSDVRMEHTKNRRHKVCVRSVRLATSVIILSVLLSLTTQQPFAPWDTIVQKEQGTAWNIHVLLEPSTTEQVTLVIIFTEDSFMLCGNQFLWIEEILRSCGYLNS